MGYISLILLLGVGGFIGTSLVAENSNPGDTLYNLKTGINQDIKEGLAMGAYSEGKLQLDLLDERIKEKVNLISQGKLTAQENNEINTKIIEHTNKYISLRQEIQGKNNTEDYNALETRFENLIAQNSSIDSNKQIETSTGNEYIGNSGVIDINSGSTGVINGNSGSTGILDDMMNVDINIDLNPFNNSGSNSSGKTSTGN